MAVVVAVDKAAVAMDVAVDKAAVEIVIFGKMITSLSVVGPRSKLFFNHQHSQASYAMPRLSRATAGMQLNYADPDSSNDSKDDAPLSDEGSTASAGEASSSNSSISMDVGSIGRGGRGRGRGRGRRQGSRDNGRGCG